VPWTVDMAQVRTWLMEGHLVVSRTILTGSGGMGIHVAEGARADVVEAPLYTRYVKKSAEYRVHVFRDSVIRVQEKRRKRGVPINTAIRNHQNGWVFCEVADPQVLPHMLAVPTMAVGATNALGLDFGAVDMIYNRHHGWYVLEINTAPGLEGSTLTAYANAVREWRDA
jgi:hypothetical protein